MRLCRTAVAALAVPAFIGAPAPFAAAAGVAGGAVVVADRALSSRLHEVTVRSAALERETRFRILLPADYEHSTRRYPVLYLLHGAGDDHTSWTANTDVEALTAAEPLIVVMPDAGKNATAGWYSDWFNGGAGGPPRWESYHIGELIPLVDAEWRTDARREGRAVAGLSMGGFGAMSYAARHPDLFVAAAAFSGAVDTTTGGPVEAAAFGALHDRFGTPGDDVWGPFATQEVRWRDHCPVDLAANLRGVDLYLATGNGVVAGDPHSSPDDGPVEAGVYVMNTNFHLTLTRLGIPHTYDDYGPGGHSWWYWQRDLHRWLPRLRSVLAAPPPPPSTWTYTTAEPSFSVWGWTVTMHRSVREFAVIERTADGVTLQGSGTAAVVTPPVYRPGAAYTVTGGGPTRTVVADGGDRLRFDVDLGPSHTAQQFTPEGRAAEAAAAGAYMRRATVTITPASAEPGGPASVQTAPTQGGTLPATGGPLPASVAAVALAVGLAVAAAARRASGGDHRLREKAG